MINENMLKLINSIRDKYYTYLSKTSQVWEDITPSLVSDFMKWSRGYEIEESDLLKESR